MESDVTQSAWFYKSWAWFEAHKKQVAWIVGGLLLLGLVAGFMSWRHNEAQIAANEELSLVTANVPPGESVSSEALLKVAADHPNTAAGARALLLGATHLFIEGKFSEAQAQFEKYLREYGSSSFAGHAHLGIAASLDAQGKTNEALAAYRQIAERRGMDVVGPQARLALGRLYLAQGDLKLARDSFEQLARSDFGMVGQEAAMHLEELMRDHPELAERPPQASNISPTMFLEPASTNLESIVIEPGTSTEVVAPVTTETNGGLQ